MQFTLITLTTLLATVFAIPSDLAAQVLTRQAPLCSSGTAQCCDVNVLGVADLNCANPTTLPANITDFNSICASVGKINMCCILPILEQGILCSSPDNSD